MPTKLGPMRTAREQLADADRICTLGHEKLHAEVFGLIRQRDRLTWELKRAEIENENLHRRLDHAHGRYNPRDEE